MRSVASLGVEHATGLRSEQLKKRWPIEQPIGFMLRKREAKGEGRQAPTRD
jgi:hypothetical protein